jgi:Carboxypeptidase regulatory-like domain
MLISVQALTTTLLCIPGLISQSIISGDLTGTVTDPSAASLPNAEVTLQNAGTSATQTVATNTQGVYRFAFIPPGTYSVTVAAPGFRNARQTHLQVVAGQSTTADFQLVLAAATETVDVTGARCRGPNGKRRYGYKL